MVKTCFVAEEEEEQVDDRNDVNEGTVDELDEESDHEVNALANAASNDSDNGASRVESNESNSDDE